MSDVASPPLVPTEGFDTDVHVVMEELDHLGRVYRETDEERADRETLIRDLIAGLLKRAYALGGELTEPVNAFVQFEMERAKRRLAVASPLRS